MKRLIILIFLMLTLVKPVFSQSSKYVLNKLLTHAEIDGRGHITYNREFTFENLTKDELFDRAIQHFVVNYRTLKNVVQNQDREGGIIVARGTFPVDKTSEIETLDLWHIIRVEVEDGKARVSISITDYEIHFKVSGVKFQEVKPVTKYQPFGELGKKKTFTQNLYQSHLRSVATLKEIERTLEMPVSY